MNEIKKVWMNEWMNDWINKLIQWRRYEWINVMNDWITKWM